MKAMKGEMEEVELKVAYNLLHYFDFTKVAVQLFEGLNKKISNSYLLDKLQERKKLYSQNYLL
jgi:hypothetical protein